MFDSPSELIEKIHLGEDSTIEFKRQLPRRDSLADEIAAFANARGGVILIGVDNHGDIVGLDQHNLDQTEKTVVEICRDSIAPRILIFAQKLQLDGKDLLKIEIPRSLYLHKSPGGYFARQGSSKRAMPKAYLARLLQKRSRVGTTPPDRQSVPKSTRDTLRKDLYQRFLTVETPDHEVEELLLKRDLLVREGSELRASVAGLLMCHDRPDDFLYNSFIQAVFYRGRTKDANYQIDAKDFRGPLDRQIMDAYKFVERYNQVSARKDVGRTERSQYSMRAVFEALVNAVVHRDYSRTASKIRLFMFADRLELSSPGALANTLTVERLRYGQATRNELLARLLSELTVEDIVGRQVARRYFLERRGEGVGIILDESAALSDREPVYELFDDELRLTIFAAKSLQEEQEL